MSQIAIDVADSSAAFASLEIVETKASVATNPCSSIFFQRAVGVLWPDSVPPRIEELREGLRDLGYVEAENIIIEYRCADGMRDRAARMQILSRCTKTLVVQD